MHAHPCILLAVKSYSRENTSNRNAIRLREILWILRSRRRLDLPRGFFPLDFQTCWERFILTNQTARRAMKHTTDSLGTTRRIPFISFLCVSIFRHGARERIKLFNLTILRPEERAEERGRRLSFSLSL